MIRRREILFAGAVGVGIAAAPAASACTIVTHRRLPFSDVICREELDRFVALLNEGPDLAPDALTALVDERGVTVDDEMIESALDDTAETDVERTNSFYRKFRYSGGRPDPRPIVLDDLNRIRRLDNRASYQFTLRRYSYHPADPEGCNGIGVHDEYYGIDRTSYLATFLNNRLQAVRPFPEWYLEEQG